MGDDRNGKTTTWLDGATGSELQRAGLAVRAPWWTTLALNGEARRTRLREVHEGYLGAGAQVITANTFRCNLRALRRVGLEDAGLAWMVHAAVGVARSARGAERARIAGSMAPVEDCYRPDLVPSDEELRAEHGWLATELMRSGADLVLVETMNTAREAAIALEQVQAAGGRAWVSFVIGADGLLLSGEPLVDAAKAAERDGAEAVLVNCAGPEATETALRLLREALSGPIGAYPNIEDRQGTWARTHLDRHLPAALEPAEFADLLARWGEEYAPDILGGCCGTTPAHLAAARNGAARVGG
ncbi:MULTISPECIES: homocysteine S-methyltransferase family protein [Thermomonosporaceae]|uniref:homocysteine S-methyltransferase family protein n=1 Tax=Thermomonosporaceae TaxID=2012 RepID=UPI00255AB65A|nr:MULTISPECIES: homocysteine S-methyltransferase family protein [Thermomonosporaceae]MDL4776691.1 homocysteine S-methyltransferase family protein [Actinomadura xylanilytica]